jgi:hypothetical protein
MALLIGNNNRESKRRYELNPVSLARKKAGFRN